MKAYFRRVFTEESQFACALPDALILLFFAAVTFGMFLYLWWGAAPELTITGDAANIAGFAAAQDHPGRFTGDELLSRSDNFAFYRTVHIPMLRALSKISGGYGQAFMWLSWPHMLLQAAGFYFLGFAIFRVRIWAVIFSFVTLWFGMIPAIGELWGLYKDPLPRVSFQALLPFVLAASYVWRDKPGRWPWLMAASGLLTYVHPVSAPAWGLALWCGFLLYVPRAWPFFKKLLVMLFNGCVFLIVTAPFISIYFGTHSHGPDGNYGQVFSIMRAAYTRGLFDIPFALGDFLYTISFKFGPGTRMLVPALLLPGAVCGFVYLKKFNRTQAGKYKIVIGWLAGLLFVSAFLPFAEHGLCRIFQIIPIEISFIRGLRYLVPLCMLLCIWPVAEYYRNCESETARKRILGLGLAAAALWGATHLPPGVARSAYRAAVSRQAAPLVPHQEELKQALDFIRDDIPPGTRVFVAPPGRVCLAVRYYALQPVVFSFKDRGAFAFGNHAKLIEWEARRRRLEAIAADPAPQHRMLALTNFAASLGATVLFLENDVAHAGNNAKARRVFRNDVYSIFILNTKPPAGS